MKYSINNKFLVNLLSQESFKIYGEKELFAKEESK